MNLRAHAHRFGVAVIVAAVWSCLASATVRCLGQVNDALAAHSESDIGTYDLRPHFRLGRTARYELWGKRTVTFHVEGPRGERSSTQTMESEGEVIWKVTEVHPDGTATCVLTLQWFAVTIDGPNRDPNRVDSRDGVDEGDPISRRLGALVNKPLRFEMNADGAVQSVDGTDAVSEVLGTGEGQGLEDAVFLEQASTLATIPGTSGAHALDSQWESSNAWTRSYGKLHQTMVYRLGVTESVAGIPVATVTGNAELSFEPDPKQSGAADQQLNVKMTEGSATTQIMFDLQRHEVVGRNDVERVRIETSAKLPQLTFSSTIEETIQSQAIRIVEDLEP